MEERLERIIDELIRILLGRIGILQETATMSMIDWATISEKDRARIYEVLRAIEVGPGPSVQKQIEAATGAPFNRGPRYIREMSKGGYARPLARQLHAWLSEHHVDIAHNIAPNLFDKPVAPADHAALKRYIDEHAIRCKLRIGPLTRERGMVERVRTIRTPDATLRPGQEFCFELDSNTAGAAIMFQGRQNSWHPIPLGPDEAQRHTQISPGTQLLPRDHNGRPGPLIERAHLGEHWFVLLVGPLQVFREITDEASLMNTVGSDPRVAVHLVIALITERA